MAAHPRKIMCAVDLSEFSEIVLSYGASLAGKYEAKLMIVHSVIDAVNFLRYSEFTLDPVAIQEQHMKNSQAVIEKMSEGLTVEKELLLGRGDAANEIQRLALEHGADLVIAATHGESGIQRLIIGSVTEKLMKILHCPLLVLSTKKKAIRCRKGEEIVLNKILVGVDFSDDSTFAYDLGIDIAMKFDAEVHMAHVIKPTGYYETPNQRSELEERLKSELRHMIPEDYTSLHPPVPVLLQGEPFEALLKYSREHDIDLIVLGIRGHTLWEKLMVGSTTDRVIRTASCPVLAVRRPHS